MGREHDLDLVKTWSLERTSGPYYLYDYVSKEFLGEFTNLVVKIGILIKHFRPYIDTGVLINDRWVITTNL